MTTLSVPNIIFCPQVTTWPTEFKAAKFVLSYWYFGTTYLRQLQIAFKTNVARDVGVSDSLRDPEEN